LNMRGQHRAELEYLLPWHATGTLHRRDGAHVERALAVDPVLAGQLDLVRAEMAETICLNERLGVSSGSAAAKLFAAIGAGNPEKPAVLRVGRLTWRTAEFFFAHLAPRTLVRIGAAAAIAIVLQAGVIAGLLLREAHPNGPPPPRLAEGPAPIDGIDFHVVFTPRASIADVAEFLRVRGAVIVDGPKGGGMYRVRFVARSPTSESTARILSEAETRRDIVAYVVPAGR
jgi:hypothetical protein